MAYQPEESGNITDGVPNRVIPVYSLSLGNDTKETRENRDLCDRTDKRISIMPEKPSDSLDSENKIHVRPYALLGRVRTLLEKISTSERNIFQPSNKKETLEEIDELLREINNIEMLSAAVIVKRECKGCPFNYLSGCFVGADNKPENPKFGEIRENCPLEIGTILVRFEKE